MRMSLDKYACEEDERIGCSEATSILMKPSEARWTLENRPWMDASKPANGRSQDIVFIPWRSRLEQAFFVNQPDEGYSGRTCAEGTATQGCDRSADKVAGMAGRRKTPPVPAAAELSKDLVLEARGKREPSPPV